MNGVSPDFFLSKFLACGKAAAFVGRSCVLPLCFYRSGSFLPEPVESFERRVQVSTERDNLSSSFPTYASFIFLLFYCFS